MHYAKGTRNIHFKMIGIVKFRQFPSKGLEPSNWNNHSKIGRLGYQVHYNWRCNRVTNNVQSEPAILVVTVSCFTWWRPLLEKSVACKYNGISQAKFDQVAYKRSCLIPGFSMSVCHDNQKPTRQVDSDRLCPGFSAGGHVFTNGNNTDTKA